MIDGPAADVTDHSVTGVIGVETLEDQAPHQKHGGEQTLVEAVWGAGLLRHLADERGGEHLLEDGQALRYSGISLRLSCSHHVILLAWDMITWYHSAGGLT